MTMSDRLAVMRHGRIEQIGGPEDVYERPRTEFVAGFLGASNLLDGVVESRDGDLASVRVSDGSTLTVPAPTVPPGEDKVKIGVRPEKIRLERGSDGAADGWNSVAGTLRVATFVGVSHQFTVEGPDQRVLTVYAQNLGGEPIPQPGEPVRLLWRPEHTFVVDASAPLADWEEEQ